MQISKQQSNRVWKVTHRVQKSVTVFLSLTFSIATYMAAAHWEGC